MQNTFKRALAALLCLSILLSLGICTVSVSAEGAATPEYLPPVIVGEPLTTSINCRDQVIFNNYNGVNYMYFSAGGTFYVFDIDKYTANPGAHEPVFSGASGITNVRGMAVDSKGVVYVVGDAAHLMKYDPATQALSQIACALTKTAWGLDVDEHDNIYIAGRPDMVVKYDPGTGNFTKLWSGNSTNQVRSLAYSNGYIYANRPVSSGNSTIVKINASTGELVKEAEIPAKQSLYTSIAGNVVFGGNGSHGSPQVALNTETLEPVDLGLQDAVVGFVTKEHNGKSYFIASTESGKFLCSFDVATGKASVLEGFTDTDVILRCRDPFMTLTVGGTTYENCLMACTLTGVLPRYFNLDTTSTTIWNDFTGNLTEAKKIQNLIAGPEGSNEIYVGGYLTGNVAVYNTSTKKITPMLYANGHDQSDSFYWYDGKLYGGSYSGAYLIQYDPGTKTVKELINGLQNDFKQRRIHEVCPFHPFFFHQKRFFP